MIYHLGPVGSLIELPPIESDQQVDNPGEAPEATHTSLGGASTTDTLGRVRKSWTLPWLYLTADEFDLLDSMRRGMFGRPLRLVDPNVPNLVPSLVATGGSERRTPRGWSADTGTRRWRRLSTRPPGARVLGAVEWTRDSLAGDDLATGRVTPLWRVPLLPDTMQASCDSLVRNAGASTVVVTPALDRWDAAGTRSTVLGDPLTLPPGTWAPAPVPAVAAAGAVTVAPCWRIATGQPTSTVQVTAVRCGHGPVAPPYSTGGGAPAVRIDSLRNTHPAEGEWNPTMTLVETGRDPR